MSDKKEHAVHPVFCHGWVSPFNGSDQIEVEPGDSIVVTAGKTFLRFRSDPNNEIRIKPLRSTVLDNLTDDKPDDAAV